MVKPLVLSSDVVSFCQSGQSIVLGSRQSDGSPIGGAALACRIDPRSQTVRLVLKKTPNAPLLQAIAQGGGIAATFSQPTTHKSIQLKGRSARAGAARAEDKQLAAEQTAGFYRELVTVGYPELFAHALNSFDAGDLGVLTFTATEAFLQTPGPDAGSALP
jgi:hypothetical protein